MQRVTTLYDPNSYFFPAGQLILHTLAQWPFRPHAAYQRVHKIRTDRAQNTSITQYGVNFFPSIRCWRDGT